MDAAAPLLPPVVALVLIFATRRASLSLAAAVFVGVLLLNDGALIPALKSLFADHLFPALSGSWHLGAILFTLLLGSFATILERSGGFQILLQPLTHRRENRTSRTHLLTGIYGLGLLCFFDGLANAVLLGRVARPLTDGLRISRQFLAYLIDSTSACVACVAFISTWIATQLSLIGLGTANSAVTDSPISLFFASIPANPYCLLTLLLLPLVIYRHLLLGPMKKAEANAQITMPQDAEGSPSSPSSQPSLAPDASSLSAILPLFVLVLAVPSCIWLWQEGPDRSWRQAFSSAEVPHAMVAASIMALGSACLAFPRSRWKELDHHALEGASSLLPALLILIAAWTLGSVFQDLGTAGLIADRLAATSSPVWLPLTVFLLGSLTSFLTGTSWGTMGLLMPIVLPLGLDLGADSALLSQLIGAVFGGAVFGDHCSPFSDTTIVSSLASGCTPTSHVATQLPYALLTSTFALLAYSLMALSLDPWLATATAALGLTGVVFLLSRPSAESWKLRNL